jgi:hypothetical protein
VTRLKRNVHHAWVLRFLFFGAVTKMVTVFLYSIILYITRYNPIFCDLKFLVMQKTVSILIGILFINTIQAFSSDNIPSFKEFNQAKNPVALLVLFDGAPGYAQHIPTETTIPFEAQSSNIQCIGINQNELFLSDTIYDRIKATIEFCMKKYKIPNDNILLGGFSLGGYTVFRFAEMAKEKGDIKLIPRAIVGVDPMLDHLAVFNYAIKEINRDCQNEGSQKYGKPEAIWLKDYYLNNFGSPDTNSAVYISRSCYSPHLRDGGNAKLLLDIPIRIYHELDLMWYIKERCRDVTDENVIVGSQMINFLYNHGNKNVILIETHDKGKRADGRRHPHSWSIADPKETVDWLKGFIK